MTRKTKTLGQHALALLRQFTSPIVLILIIATIISMVVGDVLDGTIILAIIIPSGFLSYYQEFRADRTMQSLLARIETTIVVMRAGQSITITPDQIAIGDQVTLKAGSVLPADLKINTLQNLMVDESSLTGESFAAEKTINDRLFYGTSVVSGTATAEVTAVGKETEFGALVERLKSKDIETTFELGIKRFGFMLVWAMLALVLIIFTANILLNRPFIDALLFSLALAVGLTPQLLPVIVMVSLTTGARAMAKKDVLVKRLDAIEDFGSINVICTDKTGTLTNGETKLISALDTQGNPSESVALLALLNAKLQSGFENPMDRAIITDSTVALENQKLIAEVPYDFERRLLSVLVDDGTMITKGAFASVLKACNREGDQTLTNIFEAQSMAGFRVIGIASKKIQAQTITSADEANMEFAGFLLFKDPAKADAAQALQELRDLNIDLFMMTGDNPLVAAAVAKDVGLASSKVLTGAELKNLSDEQLTQRLFDCRVLAELDPLQKERVVQSLRKSGNSVGFFGDGINDSAALKAADVGISVDTAVDVAKETASIVLLDKSLSVVATGVKLGRKTFVNTMKYIRVGVSAAFGNMLSMAVASCFLPFLPLLPAQILLLNFFTDFPAVMIASDRVDDEDIAKPHMWDIKNIRNFMIVFGLLSSVFDLATFAILSWVFSASATLFRSGWFVESTLTELAVMLILRTSRAFWKSKPGKGLWISSAIIAALVIAIPFTPMAVDLRLQALPPELLLFIAILVAIYALLNQIAKRVFRKTIAN